MSYIYHGPKDWIKQSKRIVQTFRSGLCMIQQEYLCRADFSIDYFTFREGEAISVEDALPCIDGAYIFPAPSYQDMGNGFVKCTVTAYGRVNTKGVIQITKRLGNYTVTTSIGGISESVQTQKIFDVINFNFVAAKSEIVPIPTSPTPLIYNLNLTPLPTNSYSSAGFEFNSFVLTQVVDIYEVNSYGQFAEYNISISAAGQSTQVNI